MATILASDHGKNRSDKSSSGAAILATFIPTFTTACIYVAIFLTIRSFYRKIYSPRTFLGTVAEKDRTPALRSNGSRWIKDFRALPDKFVLQHNSLDTYLFLRFFKLIIFICAIGCLLTWPILLPVNANAGGTAEQLDRLSFSNVDNNASIWAHTIVAWTFFGVVFATIVYERLHLIGVRQAHYIHGPLAQRLSARTVLYTNVPHDALLPENLERFFGEQAQRSWPVKDAGDLDKLIERRKDIAMDLEAAEVDLIVTAVRAAKKSGAHLGDDASNTLPDSQRPQTRRVPLVGQKNDKISANRTAIAELSAKIKSHSLSPARTIPEQAGVFVAFTDQAAAHRAYQNVRFKLPVIPIAERFLDVQPKEVLWTNLTMPLSIRLSKSTLAVVFVVVFTLFFSIPIGLIGTLSNVKYLASEVSWLSWINNLPPAVLGLLTGLLPPYLISEFTSYVPKLFRHVAKMSGEPTTRQAELLVQAWYFGFQLFQVFLVTTFSSGGAAVAASIVRDPSKAPDLLAEALPKASNFYLTYIILQGTAGAADNLLNYSDLFSYLFYMRFWHKTPRDKFQEYARMKGFNWAKLLPKFTNMFVIAVAYSCIAPLVLGFALVGFCVFYIAYRYNCLYVYQLKIDSHGEAYKRALKQMMAGIYIAQLCLIGLFGARQAGAQTVLMVIQLVLTAVVNLVVDRILEPLEVLLGVDKWSDEEVPFLAEHENIDPDDEAALHIASHNRRLGLRRLPRPAADFFSATFDKVISASHSQTRSWLTEASARADDTDDHDENFQQLSDDELKDAYSNPAFAANTPKLWIPRDPDGVVSKEEIRQNEEAGITVIDSGASVDHKGRLHWEADFAKVPIYKATKLI